MASFKKQFFLFSFFLLIFFPWGVLAQAAPEISAAPSIIDAEDSAGGINEYKIKIKNNTENKISLYALVYDISSQGGLEKYSDPSELDSTISLAAWVDFRRAVIEIEPFAEVEQILKIQPSPEAKSGIYHAEIILSRGSNRDLAAQNADKLNEAKIRLNWKIIDHSVERAEIAEFKPEKALLFKSPLKFSLKVRNIGTKNVNPKGEIVLYTKNGKELSYVKIDPTEIAPGETAVIPASLDFSQKWPGRYKARLSLDYSEGKKDLQDVIYFLYLPKKILIAILILVLIFISYLTFVINQKKGIWKRPAKKIKDDSKDYVINLKN